MKPATLGFNGGLFCYLITPFDADGEVSLDVLEQYVDAVIACGADGVTCVASTTEGPYLTERERFAVVETVCRVATGRVPVNVGIGAVSTRQSLFYAEHAQKSGASTMMVEMQTYLRMVDFAAVRQHFAEIAKASSIPIRLYNIPHTTDVDLRPEQIADMADIDGIDAVKDATGDPKRVRDIKSLCGDRFAIFCGRHHAALGSYEYGAIGWEGAFHPLFGKEMVALHRQLRAGEFASATKMYRRLDPLFTFFKLFGVPQCIKEISTWTNLNLGAPRRPLSGLAPRHAAGLRRVLASSGFPC